MDNNHYTKLRTPIVQAPTAQFTFRNQLKRNLTFLVFTLVTSVSFFDSATADDKETVAEIKIILTEQAKCWNNKDIEGFMGSYWNSEQLTFSGGGKTTRGWNATLERYKEKYPPEKMGTLTFDHLETTQLSESAAMVLGQWHLKSKDTKSNGNFSLVLRKMDGKWKIIHDHSSSIEEK